MNAIHRLRRIESFSGLDTHTRRNVLDDDDPTV
jgi:hypothetical protein